MGLAAHFGFMPVAGWIRGVWLRLPSPVYVMPRLLENPAQRRHFILASCCLQVIAIAKPLLSVKRRYSLLPIMQGFGVH